MDCVGPWVVLEVEDGLMLGVMVMEELRDVAWVGGRRVATSELALSPLTFRTSDEEALSRMRWIK